MSALSKSLADALYNHVLRNTPYTPPATIYLALHVSGGGAPAHPGKTEATAFGNEASYDGYQRQAITFDEPTGAEVGSGDNTNALVFPQLGGAEADFSVTGLTVWSAEKAGTAGASGQLLLAGEIDVVRLMQAGDAPLVSVGSIIATFGAALP